MDTTHLPTRPPSSDPRVAQAGLALVFRGNPGDAVLDDDWTSADRSELMRKIQMDILDRIGERFLDRWSSFTVPLNDEGVTEEEQIRDTIRRELEAFNESSTSFDVKLADDENSKPTGVEYCWIGDRVICKHSYVVEATEYEPPGKGKGSGSGRPWQIRYKPTGAGRTFIARMFVTLSWSVRRKRGDAAETC